MRRIRKISLEELIMENKKTLLNDRQALERIDNKLIERRLRLQG